MKIEYRMVDTKKKLENIIKKAYNIADNANEFNISLSEIYRQQQFYTWKCFLLLVEDLTGYTI